MIRVDGAPLEVDTRKAVALLAYLAVEGEVLRDLAAAMFWGDSSDERARASLRRTLSSLRSGTGLKAVTADRLKITLSSMAKTDVAQFDTELAETTAHDHTPGDVCASCIPHLRRATDLYRGDFLAGFSVREAAEFEDWTRTVAESFRIRAGEAFQRLGIAYAAEGNYPQAIKAVTRWTELDLLHEPAHRLLMLLNAWTGDRPGAVAVYRNFAAILDIELGVAPLEETTELFEAILDEDLPPAPGISKRPQARSGSAKRPETTMLNREDELDRLERVVTTRDGAGALIVLDGAAWIGKTRLIEELGQLRAAQGDLLVTAKAFRMERNLPYGVVAQILKGLNDSIENRSEQIPTWALLEGARILPNLWSETPDKSTDVLGELRVLEAIEQILIILSHGQSTVIVVEDLQWIDSASGELLLYLTNRIRSIPITLVVSHRTGEMLSQQARTLVAMADEQITLGPLKASDIDPAMAGKRDVESLLADTGGVPILVLEEISGSGAHDGASRYMESSLAGLSDLASQILAAASVLAGISTTDLLQEVSGRSESELVEGVEELLRTGILREVPGGNTLDFNLDSMRDVVYQSTTLVRRRHLHRRVAMTLCSSQRTRRDARLAGTAAAHFRDAGDEQSAADWYRIAADLSREMYAHVEAQEFLENALALGDDDVAEIRLALGEMAIARGEYQGAMAQLTLAASRAEGATLALVEHRLGQANRALGRFAQAESNYQNAVPQHPEPADLFSDWALLEHRLENQTEATKLAKKAVSFARKSGDATLRSRVYNISAVIEEDPTKAMGLLDLAITEDDDQVSKMASLNNRAHLLSSMGNPGEAIDLLSEAITIAQETGHRHREAALLSHLADSYHRQGNTPLAEETQEKAVALFADIDSGQWEPEVWLMTRW